MKLIMTKGLPGSGKTTWAKTKDIIRVNKDDLRKMVHDSKWSKSNERVIILTRDMIIQETLKRGDSIIVDDTNLDPKHEKRLRELAEQYNADFEIKDFTNVPLEECIARDQKRQNYVGEKVIRDMHKRYLDKSGSRGNPLVPFGDTKLKQCVIFDMDGTLACVGDRSPYDAKSCDKDLPNLSIIALNKWVPKDVDIIIFSGRTDDAREQTINWLERFNVDYSALHMRKAGDFRKDAVIKEEMFNAYIKGKYQVIFAVDDRNQVVELWRRLGITTLQVNAGEF